MTRADCAALIMAAGSGERFGGETPKQYRLLAGKPVLRHTVEAFLAHPAVDRVRVVINPAHRSLCLEALHGLPVGDPIDGGASRQASVRLGLEALGDTPPGFVLVQDGVRPLTDAGTIKRVRHALDEVPAAIAGVPVVDTLKRGQDGLTIGTVDRSGLWRAQTPQGFAYDSILAAHRTASDSDITDDAAIAERAGLSVALVPGNEDNLKVTTEDDLVRAEALLSAKANDVGAGDIRVGNGFDVHRFGPGDHVTLCGIAIPFDRGLVGHSDADVGLHAITDAILGALGAGDIGQHFPPSDPQWKGQDSAAFLRHAAKMAMDRGGRIAHVDVTLICEMPKVGPHREAMTARIAEILGPGTAVSVKATTTEGLGFAGRGEGIAAQATATLRLPMGPITGGG